MDLGEYLLSDGEESHDEQSRTPPTDSRRKPSLSSLGRRLAAVASTVGGAIARSAEAAAEVLADAELRRRGAQVIAHNASNVAKGIQHGLQTGASSIQRGLQTVQRGPKQIQAVLQRVQHQIEQQRMAALLEEQRDAPVDVQVGFQLYEDSPQELRSRLWMALLEHPGLVAEYQALLAAVAQQRASSLAVASPDVQAPTEPAGERQPGEGSADGGGDAAAAAAVAEGGEVRADRHVEAPVGASSSAPEQEAGSGQGSPGVQEPAQAASPAAAVGAQPGAEPPLAEAATEGQSPSGQAAGEGKEAGPHSDIGHLSLDAGHLSPPASRGGSRAASPPARPPGGAVPSRSGGGSSRRGTGGWDASSPRLSQAGTPTSAQSRSSSSSSSSGAGAGAEGWEVVDDGSGEGKRRQGAALLADSGAARLAAGEGYSREQEAFRNKLMAAMMAVPWPLPTEYPEECRYATLLQISVGQEEVDEVISRDIHRTFPEHPLFGFEQGQQALFRVLKAYSLHDIEVGYCQGMAFVAGLLLFYMNEEPAFQMFCRLLGSAGPDLRRLYLPGLEGLKAELRAFELLMARHLPNLKAHLEACGVVPVLFASQWFLTAFSCPFPVHFACRLVDVMAAEGDASIMLRTALTIMAECEADLFVLDDFEAIITYLKVEPVQWPLHRVRRVLDAAVHSAISREELAAVAAAVEEGYAGSLSRHTTSHEAEVAGGVQYFPAPAPAAAGEASPPAEDATAVAALPATATAAERALSLRHHHNRGRSQGQAGPGAPGASLSRQASPAAAGAAAGAAAAEEGPQQQLEGEGQEQGAGAALAGGEGAGARRGDDLEAELAKHNKDLDEEYMAMVLALDMMWADSGDAAGTTYEAAPATATQPPAEQQQ